MESEPTQWVPRDEGAASAGRVGTLYMQPQPQQPSEAKAEQATQFTLYMQPQPQQPSEAKAKGVRVAKPPPAERSDAQNKQATQFTLSVNMDRPVAWWS
jgi:hypothetical protein